MVWKDPTRRFFLKREKMACFICLTNLKWIGHFVFTFQVYWKPKQICNPWLCTLFQKIEVWLQYYTLQIYNTVIKIFLRLCVCCMLVAQSCPTLCDPMDCSPPGSSVCGILQARILEWIAMPSSKGSSQPRDWTQVSHIAGGLFTIWALWEDLTYSYYKILAMFPMFYNISL